MTDGETKSRRCPYCGCGFEPREPEQRYCSPFCEQEDRARGKGAGPDAPSETEARRDEP